MDLRAIVASCVDKAIDGSINYSGEDKEQNRHIWVNLMTDRIMGAFIAQLPDEVDVDSKYELDPKKGLLISLDPEDTKHNDLQLEQLSHYSSDTGWNHYRYTLEKSILKPYNLIKQEKSATIKRIGDNN